jgi:hypothetical protein
MNQIPEAIRDHIIFKFVDGTNSTRFRNTHHRFIITSDDSTQGQLPRWGEVVSVGPNCEEVKVGEFALIENGMWTPGFYHEEERYWKTDETKVILVSDEPSTTYS